MSKINIGIYGFGSFAKLMAKELSPFFKIHAYSRSGADEYFDFVNFVDEKELFLVSDYLIFSIPVQAFEDVLRRVSGYDKNPKLKILDVSSVKEYPLNLLEEAFPKEPILGTHPIFGPQSVKKYGLANSKIVLTNLSFPKDEYEKVKKFLKEELSLCVIELDAKEHDRQMAWIQAVSHLVGRALFELGACEYETQTKSYKHLMELKELLKDDSWELFKTIQNYNPSAKEIRKEFIEKLLEIERRLNE